MKQQLIRSLFLLGFSIIAFGCVQDEILDSPGGNGNESLFTIHAGEIQGFSGDRYIMATSPLTGEVLYWDVMRSFQDSITFDAGDSETVDLTYASENSSSFNITTYRDVKTEFKFSRFLYPCYEGQFSFETLSNIAVDIIFPGTREIVEFINPACDHSQLQVSTNTTIDEEKKIIYDFDNDVTVVNAYLGSKNLDFQFTFRFSGEEDYKSIVIKREDWIKVDDRNYILELRIEDLSPCNVHEIDVGIDDTWIVNSEVLTSSGDRIAIAQWSNYFQNQMGEKIRLFLQDDLEIDELFLEIRRNNTGKGVQFQKKFENIPTCCSSPT